MLQAMLEPITEATPDWLAQQAIQFWLAAPRTRDARVRKLLDRDESIPRRSPPRSARCSRATSSR